MADLHGRHVWARLYRQDLSALIPAAAYFHTGVVQPTFKFS